VVNVYFWFLKNSFINVQFITLRSIYKALTRATSVKRTFGEVEGFGIAVQDPFYCFVCIGYVVVYSAARILDASKG